MEILTPAQLADRLQVKRTWVYEQTRNRANGRDAFPHIKMGRYLRFDWNDVLALLERQKRGDYSLPISARLSRARLGGSDHFRLAEASFN